MAKATFQTASGVTVPMEDVVLIRKDARNQTVVKILAGIGLVTVGWFLVGLAKAYEETNSSE